MATASERALSAPESGLRRYGLLITLLLLATAVGIEHRQLFRPWTVWVDGANFSVAGQQTFIPLPEKEVTPDVNYITTPTPYGGAKWEIWWDLFFE